MSVIILLLLISIIIAGGFLIAFFWSVKDGQFDDDYSPPRRILFEDKNEVKNDVSSSLTNQKTHTNQGNSPLNTKHEPKEN